MAKITGKAVVIWICLAVISGLVIYILRWRGNQINHSNQRSDKLNQSAEHGDQSSEHDDQSSWRERRYAAIPILAFYLAFVLTITIIERTPAKEMKYNLELFWTVREIFGGRRELISEIFWNIVLFVPVGVLTSFVMPGVKRRASSHSVWRSPWIVIFLGFLLSTGIEVTQLLMHRGLFEFDDIFYNTLGTGIGVVICRCLCATTTDTHTEGNTDNETE